MTVSSSVLEHLKQLGDSVSGKAVSPAFAERYNITFGLMMGETIRGLRTVAAPTYVTDLGVRFFKDPAIFYRLHCSLAGIEPISSVILSDALFEVPIAKLGGALDGIILFFGDYDAAKSVVEARQCDIQSSNSYELMIYAGVIAASSGQSGALGFFDAASEIAKSASDRYGAQHRAAAYEIKKLDSPTVGMRRLQHAKEQFIDDGTRHGSLNLGLFHNLEALVHVKNGSDQRYDALEKAAESLSELYRTSTDGDVRSKAGRYSSQVCINRAQLYIADDNILAALSVLELNLDHARRYSFDYLPEAIAEYSYVMFLAERYECSLRFAQEAWWRCYIIGAMEISTTIKELIVANLFELGKIEAAERIVASIASDPIGREGLVLQ